MGLRILEGEVFQESYDGPAIVISEELARSWFPGQSAVGAALYNDAGEAFTIIGVVETEARSLMELGQGRVLYRPLLDNGVLRRNYLGFTLIAKRSASAPPGAAIAQQSLIALDPNLLVQEATTLEAVNAAPLVYFRLPTILFGLCGLMGLIIAAIGIYGVMSYSVARRFKEIGIRMALGAQTARVVRSIVEHGVAVTAVGLVIGLTGGSALARVAESFVFGVTAAEPITYLGVAAIIAVVALAASAVPATRAVGVNPSETLRSE